MILKIQFNCNKENINSVMKEINTVSPLMLEAEWGLSKLCYNKTYN